MYTRQRLVDFSDFSIKQINDNFSAIFLKLSGNIDTIDLKNGAVTTEKVEDGAITADKIFTGSINIGHLDSEFVLNFPLLKNASFISYSEDINSRLGHHGTLIQQNADTISLNAISISALETNYSELSIRSDKIESNVFSIQDDIEYHASQITQMSDNISSKVSYTDYNGVEIASLINQDAYRVTISANAIDLDGITRVSETLYVGGSRYDGTIILASDFTDGSIEFDGESIRFRAMSGIYARSPLQDGLIITDDNLYDEAVFEGIIASYYPSNRCYIDYGGRDKLTVRDKDGDFVGYVEII